MEEKNLPLWDLKVFYNDYKSTDLDKDLKNIRKLTYEFHNKYNSRLNTLTAEELFEAISQFETIEGHIGKVLSYSYLLYSTNLNNSDILSFFQNTSEYITNLSSQLLFFSLEIGQLDDIHLTKILQNQKLSYYKPWIEKVRSFKDYQLSDKEEKILHEKNVTSNEYWIKLFDTTMSSLRFQFGGETLTYSEISLKTMDLDESVRKEASLLVANTLRNHIDIFTIITNALSKDKAIEENLRNAPSITTFRNLSNQVEDEVVESLVTTVKSNYKNLSERYYSLKAKWLGKEKLEFWDRNAPLPGGNSKYIPWNTAKETVLSAYHEFSPLFAELGKKFFDNNWIDARPYEGKSYGAYSHPTVPSAHPFILMSYHGKKTDISTLAHELGHGIHQLLAAEKGVLMSGTPLTLAETASIFGEQLVFEFMLKKEQDPFEKKIMLSKKIEDSLNTVVRQVMFHDFEFNLHTQRKNGELTSQQICDIWSNIQKECFGKSMLLPEESSYSWAAIPHFIHSPFYVYSYAFGNCLVNSLYKAYISNEIPNFVDKYTNLLRAGGSKKHKELLAPFSLDASQPSFWQKGLDVIASMISEIESMP